MHHGIEAGAATAHGGRLHFHQFQARDGLQDLAGLPGNALGVGQVTGVLVGDPPVYLRPGGIQGQGCQELGYVHGNLGEAAGGLGVLRVVLEQFPVFFQIGSAAGGGGDDFVALLSGASSQEGVDVAAGQAAGGFQVASMEVQSAATDLAGGNCHIAAVAGEDPDGGAHGVALHQGHYAA